MNKLDLINRYLKEESKEKREAQWDRIKKLLKYAREQEEKENV